MSLDARWELFGDASETLAAEAVYGFRQECGVWPRWDDAIGRLAECKEVADRGDAERRMLTAIRDGEVMVRIRHDKWHVELDEATDERLARRYIDVTMPRRDREEQW